MLTVSEIWQILEEVKDPEIPVVSVVEMGIIRDVRVEAGKVSVDMTPTFSGCPALHAMQVEIEQRLLQAGAEAVEVRRVLSPAWSTDWISPQARQKLKDFGLAPPPRPAASQSLLQPVAATCPYCGSSNTTLRNPFGPTLCRAIYTCNDCRQPFEQFKPV